MSLKNFIETVQSSWIIIPPPLRTLTLFIVALIILNITIKFIKNRLLSKVKSKIQIHNVEVFSRLLQYILIMILIYISIASYVGSWTGLGIAVGLMSAALGWALQKPITGIAGWIMLVLRRPFHIGDRIMVGNVRGDVKDITLTHIYLKEIGGTISSEENSGRTIMIPNSIMFEQNIINYTESDEYVLDEVVILITYESNLQKAIDLMIKEAKEVLNEIKDEKQQEPYIRTWAQASGVNLHIRYFIPARKRQEISSRITQKILNEISQSPNVEIAYPHTEVLLRNKPKSHKK